MMAMPAVMPAPMSPVPVPVMPVPVPVMTPAHFFGLETIDIVLRDNGRLCALAVRRRQALLRSDRRQRRGLRARGKRGGACDKSQGEFQKVAAFHNISLVCGGE